MHQTSVLFLFIFLYFRQSENLQNFKCGILLLLILKQIEGMYLPITLL